MDLAIKHLLLGSKLNQEETITDAMMCVDEDFYMAAIEEDNDTYLKLVEDI